jgi:clan AA aspartic protease (TIGR02281 family)
MGGGRLTSCFASLLVSLLAVTPRNDAIAQTPVACLAQGQLVTGVLTFERATHPGNGSQLSAYVLQLPTVRCAIDYRQETYGVRQIHLVKLDDDPLRKLVGQRITVRLDEVERSTTAYHFGNAISFKYALMTEPVVASNSPSAAIEVPTVRNEGTYAVPVLINKAITLDFVLDSGASDVSIPKDVFGTLVRAGTISKEDIIGSDTYTLADGSERKSVTFRIRSLKVGPVTLENVKGSVAEDVGPLLLGMSFLSRFKSWSVDNERHVLVLKWLAVGRTSPPPLMHHLRDRQAWLDNLRRSREHPAQHCVCRWVELGGRLGHGKRNSGRRCSRRGAGKQCADGTSDIDWSHTN